MPATTLARSLSALAAALLAGASPAQPVLAPADGPGTSVAAARLAGFTASASTTDDIVVVRDALGSVLRTITRAEIQALAPWMNLDTSHDGPVALALTDSGRRLYIAVADQSAASDGQPSDVMLLYDRVENALVRFARLELASDLTAHPRLAALHHRGTLYVSNAFEQIHALPAGRNQASSSVAWSASLPIPGVIRGLAVDRAGGLLLMAGDSGLYRAPVTQQPLMPELVTFVSGVRAMAYSDHHGAGAGLYMLLDEGPGAAVRRATPAQVRGFSFFTPALYTPVSPGANAIAQIATGELIVADPAGSSALTDASDTRLGYEAWLADEFAQHVTLVKGLIAPDGEPAGWVIDADVIEGAARFHPATPDAAAWAVLVLLASEEVTGDPEARDLVREVLMRYAGMLPGPSPARSADGFFTHWIDPFTGATQAGWPAEFATYSTMKIVHAAIRASAFYPGDAQIREAARAIVCPVANWDAYFRFADDEVYLKSLVGGGADLGAWNRAYTEGILFAELANAFGGAGSQSAWARWIDRGEWPTATFVFGRPVTGEAAGQFLPAFITAYSWLLQRDFRDDPAWQAHVRNLLVSHAAWTDENGPEHFTLFSAGTTKPEWGGYHADSLSDHPGDVTTMTALLGLGADGDAEASLAAYRSYRAGARMRFASGAELLYRRSSVDPLYTPNSAGLPDVSMGALGLAELLSPGFVDGVLAIPIPGGFCDAVCTGDVNGDGALSPADFSAWIGAFNAQAPGCDQNGDGLCTPADFSAWIANFNAGC